MIDKQFDQHLNKVLENLEVPFDPETWSILEGRLNSALAEEHPASVDTVDKAVFHALERLEVPYQSGHWNLMSKQLDQQAARLRRLRLAKFAEAAVFLLLIANVGYFLGINSPYRPVAPRHRADGPVAETRTGHNASSAHGHAGRPLVDPLTADLPLSSESQANSAGADLPPGSHPESVPGVHDIFAGTSNDAENREFASADFLPNEALAALSIPDRQSYMARLPIKKFQASKPFYLSVFTSADQNQVLVADSRRSAGGYSAGVSAGIRRGRWGLEAGIGYSQKNYVPEKATEIYAGGLNSGYYGSSLTEVTSNLVTVPVKVSRRIAKFGNTSAHLVAGVTTNIAVEKGYDYKTVYFPGQAPAGQPTVDPNQKPLLREAGRGVLETGGSLKGNVYATVDAGVRIEHPIAKGRYVAFVEPVYRQSIGGKGIGPKREPINTISVNAGVMAFL